MVDDVLTRVGLFMRRKESISEVAGEVAGTGTSDQLTHDGLGGAPADPRISRGTRSYVRGSWPYY